jgi:hypothetical protein
MQDEQNADDQDDAANLVDQGCAQGIRALSNAGTIDLPGSLDDCG